MLPFLRRYDYMRQAENMAANMPTMKPPRDDLFAPDLYIPLHAVFTYVVLTACNRFIAGSFKPEVMYNMVRLVLADCESMLMLAIFKHLVLRDQPACCLESRLSYQSVVLSTQAMEW